MVNNERGPGWTECPSIFQPRACLAPLSALMISPRSFFTIKISGARGRRYKRRFATRRSVKFTAISRAISTLARYYAAGGQIFIKIRCSLTREQGQPSREHPTNEGARRTVTARRVLSLDRLRRGILGILGFSTVHPRILRFGRRQQVVRVTPSDWWILVERRSTFFLGCVQLPRQIAGQMLGKLRERVRRKSGVGLVEF